MLLIIAITVNCLAHVTSQAIDFAKFATACPHMYPNVFLNCIPRGNLTAENYLKVENVTRFEDCLRTGCASVRCNAVLFSGRVCYHVECAANELCLPHELKPYRSDFERKYDDLRMVLIRPVSGTVDWRDVLIAADLPNDVISLGVNCMENDLNCDLDNCVILTNGERVCKCKFGYFMNEAKRCVPTDAQKQLESFESETRAVVARAATSYQTNEATTSRPNMTETSVQSVEPDATTTIRPEATTAAAMSTKPTTKITFCENIFENPSIVTLPINYYVLDIVNVFRSMNPAAALKQWSWSKTNDSRAAGSIVKYSVNRSPALLLMTDLVEGVYRLHLNGSMDDGKQITRTLTIIVERDPFAAFVVEIRTQTKISHVNDYQFRAIRRQLTRLIRDSKLSEAVRANGDKSDNRPKAKLKVVFYDLEQDSQTDFVIIRFFVEVLEDEEKDEESFGSNNEPKPVSIEDNDTNNFWTHYDQTDHKYQLRPRHNSRTGQQRQRQRQRRRQRLLKATKVVEFLNRKWDENRNFIGANGAGDNERVQIVEIRERTCSNRCSGRGRCDPVTRRCHCYRFWFANPIRLWCGDGRSNCEWNWPVLAALLILIWLIVYILRKFLQFICNLCCRRQRNRLQQQQHQQRRRRHPDHRGLKQKLLSPACKCDYSPINENGDDDDDGSDGLNCKMLNSS